MTTVVRRTRLRRSAVRLPVIAALVSGLVLTGQPAGAVPTSTSQAAAAARPAPSDVRATGISSPAPCQTGTEQLSGDRSVQVNGSAAVSGSDPGAAELVFTFDLYRSGQSVPLRRSPAVIAPGTSPRASFTFTDLPDGAYWYRVRARNSSADGGASAPVTTRSDARFTVDATPPGRAPAVSSYDFPGGAWGAPQGYGTFTLGTGGDDSVVGYAYSWVSESAVPTPGTGSCALPQSGLIARTGDRTTLAVPRALGTGPHTLWVRSFDRTRLLSATTTSYDFLVSRAPSFGYRYEAESLPATVTLRTRNGATVGAGSGVYDARNSATSGGAVAQLLATAGDPVDGPEFVFPFTARVDADYSLGAGLLTASHFGTLWFGLRTGTTTTWLTDSSTGQPITVDTWSAATAKKFVGLGGIRLARGNHAIVVKVVGKNAASTNHVDTGTGARVNDNGYSAALDRLTIVPVTGISYRSLADARNNDAVAPNGTAGDIGPSTGRSALSENALRYMGEYSRTSPVFTTGGVRFAMPTSYAGNDNVVAIGQTIPIEGAPRVIRRVEMLVTAACGPVGDDAAQVVSLNHSGDVAPDAVRLPRTPDFAAPRPTSAQLTSWRTETGVPGVYTTIAAAGTMPYRTQNGQVVSSPAQLYRITVPVTTAQPLASITLPYTATRLTPACDPALHVFAITYVS